MATTDKPDDTEADLSKRAIALDYAPSDKMSAPKVVASGKGYLAERILEAAKEAGVEIREDADLVEILAATEVGEEIPVEAFIAVAEVLRYVYERNGGAPPILKSQQTSGAPGDQ